MSKMRADVCAWFTVEFEDDKQHDVKDQAHIAALDWLGVPLSKLDDLEVLNVIEVQKAASW